MAGVLRGVDAVKIALTTTIETTARESGDQVRAVLIDGLRDLGRQFTEFGWLLSEVSDQITRIAEKQAEILANSKAHAESQQRTLMQLTISCCSRHSPVRHWRRVPGQYHEVCR